MTMIMDDRSVNGRMQDELVMVGWKDVCVCVMKVEMDEQMTMLDA